MCEVSTLESDEPLEAPEAIDPEDRPIGFSYPCPRCRSMRTAYCCSYENWVCSSCGLIFDWFEAQIFMQLYKNDKEESNGV